MFSRRILPQLFLALSCVPLLAAQGPRPKMPSVKRAIHNVTDPPPAFRPAVQGRVVPVGPVLMTSTSDIVAINTPFVSFVLTTGDMAVSTQATGGLLPPGIIGIDGGSLPGKPMWNRPVNHGVMGKPFNPDPGSGVIADHFP